MKLTFITAKNRVMLQMNKDCKTRMTLHHKAGIIIFIRQITDF